MFVIVCMHLHLMKVYVYITLYLSEAESGATSAAACIGKRVARARHFKIGLFMLGKDVDLVTVFTIACWGNGPLFFGAGDQHGGSTGVLEIFGWAASPLHC